MNFKKIVSLVLVCALFMSSFIYGKVYAISEEILNYKIENLKKDQKKIEKENTKLKLENKNLACQNRSLKEICKTEHDKAKSYRRLAVCIAIAIIGISYPLIDLIVLSRKL